MNLVIIPTYNEIENIGKIIHAIFSQNVHLDILIVDDTSPDGTGNKVQELQEKFSNLHLLTNAERDGLANAYIKGFKWALQRNYTHICEMDADFSHNPKYLKSMFEAAKQYDFVIGSRYTKNGGITDWGIGRRFVSKMGSLYAKIILRSPYKDQTGGFNIWHRKVLQKIGLKNIQSRGYAFQIELKYKAYKLGFTGTEVPIIFTDRVEGNSKMNGSIIHEALFNVLALRFGNKFVEFLQFAIIGGIGTIINIALFFVLADVLEINYNIAASLCFILIATLNYILNHHFTFKNRTKNQNISYQSLFKYIGVALIGFLISLILLNSFIILFAPVYTVFGQIVGILGGLVWNFFGASKLVFTKK